MMQMALSNAVHPEYGVVTIPFPIPEEEYGHCLELLEALEIGNAVPPLLSVAVAKQMLAALQKNEAAE